MKKLLILLILIFMPIQVIAIQTSDNQLKNITNTSKSLKVYSHGSLLEYREVKNNGTIATYNRYHQKTGYYKQDGSKIKYKSR